MNTKNKNNPTAFFMKNEENLDPEVQEKMLKFSESLYDQTECVLCKNPYDIDVHIPRILIHCGHTFCTKCVNVFFKKRKVRCPLCLKLVKNLTTVERLPINHTIFLKLGKEFKKKLKREGYPRIEEVDHYIKTKLNESFHRAQDDHKAFEPEPQLPPEYFNPNNQPQMQHQQHQQQQQQQQQQQKKVIHELPPDYFQDAPQKTQNPHQQLQQQSQQLQQQYMHEQQLYHQQIAKEQQMLQSKDINVVNQQKAVMKQQQQQQLAQSYQQNYQVGGGDRGGSI